MCMRRFLHRLLAGLLALAGAVTATAWADDINPPPYRGQPGSVMASWEDYGNGLILEDWGYEPGSYPLWGGGDILPGLEMSDAPGGGVLYDFWLPNFIDPDNFVKEMRIQVTFFDPADSGNGPLIWNLWGANDGAPVAGSLGGHVVDAAVTPGAFYFFEDWTMRPNPDWEFVNIFAPNGISLQEVVIDSVSYVPLPPAVFLFGSALIGLVAVNCRRGGSNR